MLRISLMLLWGIGTECVYSVDLLMRSLRRCLVEKSHKKSNVRIRISEERTGLQGAF